jgi:hypothetical protein
MVNITACQTGVTYQIVAAVTAYDSISPGGIIHVSYTGLEDGINIGTAWVDTEFNTYYCTFSVSNADILSYIAAGSVRFEFYMALTTSTGKKLWMSADIGNLYADIFTPVTNYNSIIGNAQGNLSIYDASVIDFSKDISFTINQFLKITWPDLVTEHYSYTAVALSTSPLSPTEVSSLALDTPYVYFSIPGITVDGNNFVIPAGTLTGSDVRFYAEFYINKKAEHDTMDYDQNIIRYTMPCLIKTLNIPIKNEILHSTEGPPESRPSENGQGSYDNIWVSSYGTDFVLVGYVANYVTTVTFSYTSDTNCIVTGPSSLEINPPLGYNIVKYIRINVVQASGNLNTHAGTMRSDNNLGQHYVLNLPILLNNSVVNYNPSLPLQPITSGGLDANSNSSARMIFRHPQIKR